MELRDLLGSMCRYRICLEMIRLKTVLGQPGNSFLDNLCDVLAVRCNNGLLRQPMMEINMLSFCDGILQIIIIVSEAGIRLDLADAVRLKDGRYRHSMIHQALVLLDLALFDGCALTVL